MPKPMTFEEYLAGDYDLGGYDNLCFLTNEPIENAVRLLGPGMEKIETSRIRDFRNVDGKLEFSYHGACERYRDSSEISANFTSDKDRVAIFRNYKMGTCAVFALHHDGERLRLENLNELKGHIRAFMKRAIQHDANCIYIGCKSLRKVFMKRDVIAYNLKAKK